MSLSEPVINQTDSSSADTDSKSTQQVSANVAVSSNSNPFISRYKIPLLIGLVIGLGLFVFRADMHWLNGVWLLSGVLLGIIFIDLEYIVHAYLVDSSDEKSIHIKNYIRRMDISGFIGYLNAHEYEFKELSIRSVLFHVLLALFGFYVVTAGVSLLALALVLTMLATLLYVQLMEYLQTGTLERWFWVYNGEVTQQTYSTYMAGMGMLFLLQFWLI